MGGNCKGKPLEPERIRFIADSGFCFEENYETREKLWCCFNSETWGGAYIFDHSQYSGPLDPL